MRPRLFDENIKRSIREHCATAFLIAPRPYPTLIKSLGLMLVDCQTEKSAVLSRHPFLAARPGDAEKCSGTLKNWLQKGNDDELPFCLVKPPMEPVSG